MADYPPTGLNAMISLVPSPLRATSSLSTVVRLDARAIRLLEAAEIEVAAQRDGFAGVVEDGAVEELLCVPAVFRGQQHGMPVAEPVGVVPAKIGSTEIGQQEEGHRLTAARHRRRAAEPEVNHPVPPQQWHVLLGDTIHTAERVGSGVLLPIVVERGAQQAAVAAV